MINSEHKNSSFCLNSSSIRSSINSIWRTTCGQHFHGVAFVCWQTDTHSIILHIFPHMRKQSTNWMHYKWYVQVTCGIRLDDVVHLMICGHRLKVRSGILNRFLLKVFAMISKKSVFLNNEWNGLIFECLMRLLAVQKERCMWMS